MANAWHVNILTLFPEMFPGPLGHSLAGKALEKKNWSLAVHNIRDSAQDKHATVDDKPFGGGAGMVMRPDVVAEALDAIESPGKVLCMSPRGRPLDQALVDRLVQEPSLTVVCGRYEGIDQRVIEAYNMEEISIGDFVLSGGEIAALALIDACIRQIPGVLSNHETFSEESFGSGQYANLLEYPHYTRPSEWKGRKVPQVLLSGNHKEIEQWRMSQAEKITKERRQDLWKKYTAGNT